MQREKGLGGWSLFELIWLALFTGIAIRAHGADEGLFVWFYGVYYGSAVRGFAAKGNLTTYAFGMYNTFGYAYLAYVNGLFGEVMLNLLFLCR